MTERNIVVLEATGELDLPIEFVERKGIGHPDSLCDGIAEEISIEYSKWCQRHYGVYLHHNFDKVQLVAGNTFVAYGTGEMRKPIRIQIAGRGVAEYLGMPVPLPNIAIAATKQFIQRTMKHLRPDEHMRISCYAGEGAYELQQVVDRVRANDTSFGVAHWPRSVLEDVVYNTTQFINTRLLEWLPIGEDVKVMGLRNGNEISLTVSVPFLARSIGNVNMYKSNKEVVEHLIRSYSAAWTGGHVNVTVNAADDLSCDAVYLTLTGTSAEMGDDGAVGRGNRVNGVIAPFHSASLEAACGKNPISHVGKLYNVLALLIAKDVVAHVPTVRAVTIYLLSQIGAPLDQPLNATAVIHPVHGSLTAATAYDVQEMLDGHLAGIGKLHDQILDRTFPLY